jgi:hypothetical protein
MGSAACEGDSPKPGESRKNESDRGAPPLLGAALRSTLPTNKMPPRSTLLLLPLGLATAFVSLFFLFVPHPTQATQNPRIALDMVTADDSYNEATNSMTVGTVDNCLASDPPGNNEQHTHVAYLIIQNVEDLIGWQVRFNYDGGRMRPQSVNFSPFHDVGRGQDVSFTNLPIDPTSGAHRDVLSPTNIPPAAPGPQTALIGALYVGNQEAPISPDTPPKASPDDTSYSAPAGGVLAAVSLQVMAGQADQPLLTMDLDDGDPNPPGSGVVVFTSGGSQQMYMAESALFDGYHAEGSTCIPPVTIPSLPGAPGSNPGAPGGPGGTGAPGSSVAPGTSPGASGAASGTPRPGEMTGSASPSTTSNAAQEGGSGGGGGTSAWLYVLIAVAAVALPAAGFAAWRYRSRLPWLRGR